jgi:hypothetical protein
MTKPKHPSQLVSSSEDSDFCTKLAKPTYFPRPQSCCVILYVFIHLISFLEANGWVGWIHWYDSCDMHFFRTTNADTLAWSSGREPSDVFQLLEHVYGAFDAAAKR